MSRPVWSELGACPIYWTGGRLAVPAAVLTPIAWFAGPVGGVLLAVLLTLWLIVRVHRRNQPVAMHAYAPLLVFLMIQPLPLLQVVDWNLAWPKIACLALGVLALSAIADSGADIDRFFATLWLVVVGLGTGIALVALAGTEWPAQKLLPLNGIHERLPRLIANFVPGQPAGRIHPNEVGGVLTLILPLAWATLFAAFAPSRLVPHHPLRTTLGRVFIGATALLTTAVLILTESRSAYAGLGVAPLILLTWWSTRRGRSRRSRLVGMGGLSAGIVLVGWLLFVLISSWPRDAGVGVHSLPERLAFWERSLQLLAAHPLTGIGPGQFSPVFLTSHGLFSNPDNIYIAHAHNFYLQVGLDYGISGMVAFLLVPAAFFVGLREVADRAHDRGFSLVCTGLALGLLSFLVYGLTDAIALGARGGLVLWVLLGLGMAAARVGRGHPGPDLGA